MLPSVPLSFGNPGQLHVPGPTDPGHGPTPGPTPRDPTGDPAARRKPTRLSLACNVCRKRKVRCDAGQPKCGNCTVRNETCEATDLRRPANGSTPRARAFPDGRGRRGSLGRPESGRVMHFEDWTGSNASPTSVGQNRPSVLADLGEHGPQQTTPGECSYSTSELAATPPSVPYGKTGEAGAISWVSRGYRETHNLAPSQEQAPGGTPDAVVNTDDTSYRVKFVGGTSVQCLCAFIDLHAGARGLSPISLQFRHGMRHYEEFPVPLEREIPTLPPRQTLLGQVDIFVTNIWPLFPAVDRVDLEADIDRLLEIQGPEPRGLKEKIAAKDLPGLAVMYAIACIGIDEKASRVTEESMRYLKACYGLSAHITGMPYLKSVQALFLLALALHGQARDGQAWYVVGQAIRLAQSLGLHKRLPASAQGGYRANDDLHRRLWWSCFSLEKLLQLECGRPSSTCHGDFDRALPALPSMASEDGPPDYFSPWVALAGIMGRISDRLYSRNFSSSEEMFLETCALDQALLEWDRRLPESLRPRCDGLAHLEEGSHSVLANFLSQQYFSAQITILRVSLIFPHQSFVSEIQKRSAALPPASTSRLLRGPALCAGAARAIAVQTLQLADRGRTNNNNNNTDNNNINNNNNNNNNNNTHSTVLGAGQSFLAAVVLAFCVLREPASRLAKADVELLCSLTEHVEEQYLCWGQDETFVGIFGQLRERVTAVVREGGPGGFGSGAPGGLKPGMDATIRRDDEERSGLGQTAPQGAVPVPPMGLDALMDFDMDIIGGPELYSLIEADFSCWGA